MLIFFLGIAASSNAQCDEALNDARDQFNAGNVERIPAILHDCIDKLSKEDQVQAYEMLSIAYLYLDDPFGAENSFLALLEIDPEYRVNADDPVELLYLSQQYITDPIVSFSLKAGGNISTTKVIYDNTVSAVPIKTKYKPRGGFNFAGGIDLHLNKMVSLMLDGEISMWRYEKTAVLFPDSADSQTISSLRMNYQAALPIGLKFTYPGVVSFPYVYAGYSPSFTLWSQANDKRSPEKEVEQNATGLNLLPQVNKFNQSLVVGAGYKRRIGQRFGYQYLLIDLRYRIGLTNITKVSTHYDFSNPDYKVHMNKFGWAEDDYRWNTLELTIGYIWPQYRARKKNSVTIQTIFSDLFGKKSKGNE